MIFFYSIPSGWSLESIKKAQDYWIQYVVLRKHKKTAKRSNNRFSENIKKLQRDPIRKATYRIPRKKLHRDSSKHTQLTKWKVKFTYCTSQLNAPFAAKHHLQGFCNWKADYCCTGIPFGRSSEVWTRCCWMCWKVVLSLTGNRNAPFGGKIVCFSGTFQTWDKSWWESKTDY